MKTVFHIVKKELRDMVRDKRVINGILIMPVFMVFLFVFLIGGITEKLEKNPDIKVAVVKNDDNPIVSQIKSESKAKVVVEDTLEAGLKDLQAGKVQLVLEYPGNFGDLLATGHQTIRAHYTKAQTLSLVALGAVSKGVDYVNKQKLEDILVNTGRSKEDATPITLEDVDHTKKEGLAGSELTTLLPYLIVIWAFYGGMSIVSDLVAGEKERGTMETLLISPATRSQIAFGKFGALTSICLMSSLTTLVGILAVGLLRVPQAKTLFPNGFNLAPSLILTLIATVVPLAAMFAGSMVAISAFAKNIRESQTYLTLASFLILMPAIGSQFIGITGLEKADWVKWTPVLNTAISIKGVLSADPDWPTVGASLLTSAGLAVIFGSLAVWAFQREEIVNRS